MQKVNLKPNPNYSPNTNLMLTPKAKVWKVLKEVKKTVPQIDMYKQSLL